MSHNFDKDMHFKQKNQDEATDRGDKSINTERLHKQVWSRFIRMPFGHFLDYADENGNTFIPTAEQLNASLPNPLAWGISIENGAFFGGLYLYGLCEKYSYAPNEALKNEIHIVANGLLHLCDVCRTDGCIARGVGDDGVSHPPFSSEDQFGPWLLGLWKLMNSGAADDEMRDKIKKRIIRSVNGVRKTNWNIPTEWEGVTRGSYAHADWRGASKLMFTAAVSYMVGEMDRTEFETLGNEHPDDNIYNRFEIISNGFAPDMIRDTGLIQFWIDICAQICVRELVCIDATNAAYYKKGLNSNAIAVVKFFDDYKKYIMQEKRALSYDWRILLSDVRPWSNADEATAEAGRQLVTFFEQQSPGMADEKSILGQSLFAIWIALMSDDTVAANKAFDCLKDAVCSVEWEKCGYCFAFVAEAAAYCYQSASRRVNRNGR